MIDTGFHEEEMPWDEWDEWSEEDVEPASGPRWRKPVVVFVAVLTALAIAVVPLYNVLFARPVADNGLEVCGFDYCVVQDAVREAGADLIMSRLSNTFLDPAAAAGLAAEMTAHLGVEPVRVQVVQGLDGRTGGVYDPTTRTISIESPARAWTVLHEVAHAVETGHGERFREVVVELSRWIDARS